MFTVISHSVRYVIFHGIYNLTLLTNKQCHFIGVVALRQGGFAMQENNVLPMPRVLTDYLLFTFPRVLIFRDNITPHRQLMIVFSSYIACRVHNLILPCVLFTSSAFVQYLLRFFCYFTLLFVWHGLFSTTLWNFIC